MLGRIKRVLTRGYGFIVPDGGDPEAKDIFFHASEMGGRLEFDGLNEGDQVSFELDDSREGKPQAVKVEKVDGEDTKEEVAE